MALSWGAVAGAFMAPFFYGLYWKKATHSGVVAGMVTALVINTTLYYQFGAKNSPIAASLAMIVPFIVIPLVSFVTKPPKKEIIEKAFA